MRQINLLTIQIWGSVLGTMAQAKYENYIRNVTQVLLKVGVGVLRTQRQSLKLKAEGERRNQTKRKL